jgi:endonuclease/exonuclease/phosphatase family metal-dependent hydrolase
MKRIVVTIIVVCCGIAAFATGKAHINVASYNLRQYNQSDSIAGNGWQTRYPIIADLVRFHGFDIFGTQECFKFQIDDMLRSLPGYAYTGVGREDGKEQGEHSAIFYRTDLFELVDHGDFWLSETPDKPSIGWDAVLPRICSWGHFRIKDSGEEFLFFNLHFDHVGKQARVESAKLVVEKMQELGKGLPTFLTGDFNVDQTHESYRTLVSTGYLSDSYETAELRYALNGTFNAYRSSDYTTSRIDHVFVSPEVHVLKYGVLTDSYRTPDTTLVGKSDISDAPAEIELHKYITRLPSDHFPVMVVVEF